MPLLQKILFERALTESGIPHDNLKIDLENAICYNGGKKYNVLYPNSYVTRIEKMDHTKIYDYNFKGNKFKRREWVIEFDTPKSVVEFTLKGKDIEKENSYEFDENYYQTLCSSKFTLCPGGDFDWSYRFFESCMCKSIPIICSVDEVDITMKGYKFYLKDEEHIFREDWIEHNFKLFIEEHCIN